MDDRLLDLYALADRENLGQLYLQDLSEQCSNLEMRLREIMEHLPQADREILASYIDLRDELEFQSVKTAIKVAKGNSRRI